MMSSVFFLAVLISVLQASAVSYARIGAIGFNLDIIALVFFSFRYGLRYGTALGVVFGSFNGLFCIGSFWMSLLLYTALGTIIGYIGEWFYRERLMNFLLMVFCALALVYFFYTPAHFFRLFLPSAAYNIVISIFLFYLLRKIGGLTG